MHLTGDNKDLRTRLKTQAKERNEMYRTVGELIGTSKAVKSQLDLQEAHISQLTSKVSQLRQALQMTGYERRSFETSKSLVATRFVSARHIADTELGEFSDTAHVQRLPDHAHGARSDP